MSLTPTDPATAPSWDDLAAAHRRAHLHSDVAGEVPPHRPQVAVLTCADARVSPARLFDLPAGALFVVRVAGASATPEAVASLRYAVGELGVGTVIVLGHSHCGAVTAALDGGDDPSIEPLVAPIRPAIGPGCDHLDCAVPAHVAATVAALRDDPGPLGDALRSGRATAHGAVVDLVDGSLTRLPAPPTPNPSQEDTT
jgi:carbonic anhydrase